MIGPADLDEYFELVDKQKAKETGDLLLLLREQTDLIKAQVLINQRLVDLHLRMLQVKS